MTTIHRLPDFRRGANRTFTFTPAQRLIFSAMFEGGPVHDKGLPWLAKRTDLSLRTVNRAIQVFLAQGVIKDLGKPFGGFKTFVKIWDPTT